MNGNESDTGFDPALALARRRLLASLRAAIGDERVVSAMARVPRELFVPPSAKAQAYDDRALAIGHGQTISQPFVVATMTKAVQVQPSDRILDVGTGSGYQAAILSLLAGEVVSVERIEPLAAAAAARLKRLGYDNVEVHVAGDALGWPDDAPYDGIVAAAFAPRIPRPLVAQLRIGARVVMPVGSPGGQELVVGVRTPEGLDAETLGTCMFVPLIGPGGWERDAD